MGQHRVVKLGLDDLIALLVRGSADASFVGVYEENDFAGNRRRWRVWRRARLARIENPPGSIALIAGHRTYWKRSPASQAVMAYPRSPHNDDFELSLLTVADPYEYWRSWLMTDVGTVLDSLHQVVYEGRSTWRFQGPEVKGGKPVLTVDADLGLVLRADRSDVGVFQAWTQVRTEAELGDDSFRYLGPWQLDSRWNYPPGWQPE